MNEKEVDIPNPQAHEKLIMEEEELPHQAPEEAKKAHEKGTKKKCGKAPLQPPSTPMSRARVAIGDAFSTGMSILTLSIAFNANASLCNSSTYSLVITFHFTSAAPHCITQASGTHQSPGLNLLASINLNFPIRFPPPIYSNSQPYIPEIPLHPLHDPSTSSEPRYPLRSRTRSRGLDAIRFGIDSTPLLPKQPRG